VRTTALGVGFGIALAALLLNLWILLCRVIVYLSMLALASLGVVFS
jgi:hypothetical protein